MKPGLKHAAIAFLIGAMAVPGAGRAQLLAGPHLLGTGELRPPAPPRLGAAPAKAPAKVAAARIMGSFVLRRVSVLGKSSVPPATLATAWQAQLGRKVDAAALSAIGRRIGVLEAQADIALYVISFPRQNAKTGTLRIRITEASVTRVAVISPDKHARLGLVRAYTRQILQSRPLRQSVLERAVLLMGDIAGSKIGSAFLPVRGHPDQTELVLNVRQQKVFGGFTVNNQGTPLLDETQMVANVGVNNLFHQGERTQLVGGLPLDLHSYHYYGINDIEPLGTAGAALSLSAGQLVSNPYHGNVSGNAQIYGAHLGYPLLRSVHTNVEVSIGLDVLNSSNAFLAYTLSDERTRALREAASYSSDRYFNGVNSLQVSVSQGLDIIGARRAGPAFGGPSFVKGNVTAERSQLLPKGFVLRLAFTGQFTGGRLPPSEEFDYGGPDYGMAFTAAELTGDEGIAGLAQLAHLLPAAWLPRQLAGSAIFLLTDYGEVWNRDTVYAVPTDKGASFAAGVKLRLLGKLDVTLAAATPIVVPQYAGPNQHWRFVFNTEGVF